MLIECDNCRRRFDTQIQNEFCPHTITDQARLAVSADQVQHARALLGKRVLASFAAKQPPMVVQSVSEQGMITVDGLRGEFQPHWFFEVTTA